MGYARHSLRIKPNQIFTRQHTPSHSRSDSSSENHHRTEAQPGSDDADVERTRRLADVCALEDGNDGDSEDGDGERD
jgi:hypothetical protein